MVGVRVRVRVRVRVGLELGLGLGLRLGLGVQPLEHLCAGGDELELTRAVRRQQAQHRRGEQVERLG